MKKIYSAIIVGVSVLSFTVTGLAAYDYVSLLQSQSIKARTDALKRIERGLVSQPEVFKQIEKNLNEELSAGLDRDTNKYRLDEVAWMCKALASSGDSQYVATLDLAIDGTANRRLKGHCQKGKDSINRYAERRNVKKSPKLSGFSQEMSSYINMLHSSDGKIKRDGIKHIMRSPESNEQVFDMVRDELLKSLPQVDRNASYDLIDALSYACLCLSGSGNAKYKDDLSTVISQSKNAKLAKYARKAFNQM